MYFLIGTSFLVVVGALCGYLIGSSTTAAVLGAVLGFAISFIKVKK